MPFWQQPYIHSNTRFTTVVFTAGLSTYFGLRLARCLKKNPVIGWFPETADEHLCVLLPCVRPWTRHQLLLLTHTNIYAHWRLLPGSLPARAHIPYASCMCFCVWRSWRHFGTLSLHFEPRTEELNRYLILSSAKQKHPGSKNDFLLLKFILDTLPGKQPLSSYCLHGDDACVFVCVCVYDYHISSTSPRLMINPA